MFGLTTSLISLSLFFGSLNISSPKKYFILLLLSKQTKAEFIATQGPIPNTYTHFWRMAWQEQVQNIVMLCGISEDGMPMCDVYWPDTVGKVIMYDYLAVKCISEKQTNGFYWTRDFEITNTKSHDWRKIRQYHAVGWPDRKVPIPEFLNEFDDLLGIIVDYKKSNSNPIIVHCSAGVGRTGTFISLFY